MVLNRTVGNKLTSYLSCFSSNIESAAAAVECDFRLVELAQFRLGTLPGEFLSKLQPTGLNVHLFHRHEMER